MCMMMADVMEALGIKRGDYVIRVNNRKVLDGVLEAIGLGGDEKAGRRLTVLRAIDKLDKLGAEGVKLSCSARALGWRQGRRGRFHQGCRAEQRADRHEAVLVATARNASRAQEPQQLQRNLRGRKASRSELRRSAALVSRRRIRRRPHQDRPVRRARPRILHRPGLRGRAALRNPNEDGQKVASARSAAAVVTMVWSRASAASRFRPPAFPSASRA
jgi:histidyl-tRNA synthetase